MLRSLLAALLLVMPGGDGWLRYLEFSPAQNVIRVRTYSPKLDRYEDDQDSQFDQIVGAWWGAVVPADGLVPVPDGVPSVGATGGVPVIPIISGASAGR